MFKKLIRKLSGIKSYNELYNISFEIIKSYDGGENSMLGQLARNEESFNSWLAYIKPDLVYISEASDKQEQILRLREKSVEKIETSYYEQLLLDEERDEGERRILLNKLFKDRDFDNARSLCFWSYLYAIASIECFRTISMEMGDAFEDDWFPMYCDLYEKFVPHLYNHLVDQVKGTDVLGPLFYKWQEILDEKKKEILKGYQFQYDQEKIKRMHEEEEQRQSEKEANKPPPVNVVTEHRVAELSEFLCERYEKATRGELYKIENYSQVKIEYVVYVDAGVMLIALSECIIDLDVAIEALKKAIYMAFTKLGQSAIIPKSANEISLASVFEIYKTKEDCERQGRKWLPGVCLMAPYLMYGLDPDTLSEAEQSELAGLSAKLLDDAWDCYAATKNIFGYEYELKE